MASCPLGKRYDAIHNVPSVVPTVRRASAGTVRVRCDEALRKGVLVDFAGVGVMLDELVELDGELEFHIDEARSAKHRMHSHI